jgi:hypothetical protein
LAEVYRIDVDDDDLMSRRSWRWLHVRISGLLDRPPVWVPYGDGKLAAVPSTRLGYALRPPEFD